MSYSVAIRTLGKSSVLEHELRSVFAQTMAPDNVFIYIAEGYPIPDFRVRNEVYVPVKKGMAAQRALPYSEIKSDYILMLDDDVSLERESVEKLMRTAEENNLDCIAADTFSNHRMSLGSKIYNIFVNYNFPRYRQDKAFKVDNAGFFSYINNPKKEWYLSDSAAGPASLWKTDSFRRLRTQDELWLDDLKFAYGDDQVLFNKLVKNGMGLGVHFMSGVRHLDMKTSSSWFAEDMSRYYIKSKARYLLWYRTCYNLKYNGWRAKLSSALMFALKTTWTFPSYVGASILKLSSKPMINMMKGIRDARKMTRSSEFSSLHNYIV